MEGKHFSLRGATMSDADTVFRMIEEAKAFFKERNIDMWQRGYPQFSDIIEDITSQNAYVCTDGDKVAGYIFVTFCEEDFHSTLDGRWEDDNPAVFHRIVVDQEYKHCGLGTTMIFFVEEIAKEKGYTSMRTETDVTNVPMTTLLAKLGYKMKGPLIFKDFEKLGFEKLLWAPLKPSRVPML